MEAAPPGPGAARPRRDAERRLASRSLAVPVCARASGPVRGRACICARGLQATYA